MLVEQTLGAERLWHLLQTDPYVPALGALTGGQAVQMVKAGLKAIYLSGWQVAADASADQIHWSEGDRETYWLAPIVAEGGDERVRRPPAARARGGAVP